MPPLGPKERTHLARLGSADSAETLAEMLAELRLFTVRRAHQLGLLGPNGVSNQDVVWDVALDVVADILSEEPKNRWNADKRPLPGFLKMATDGDLMLLRRSYGVRKRLPEEDRDGNSRIEGTADPAPPPERSLEVAKVMAELADLLERIRAFLAPTPDLLATFELRCQGVSCEEIARRLEVDVDTVYQKLNRALKRLLLSEFGDEIRRLLRRLDELNGEGPT